MARRPAVASKSRLRIATTVVVVLVLVANTHAQELVEAALPLVQPDEGTIEDDVLDAPLPVVQEVAAAAVAGVAPAASAVAAAAKAAATTCKSSQLNWMGYCWTKRDTSGAQAGPGGNVFVAGNAAVNAAGQLVLTSTYTNNVTNTAGEVFLPSSLGYGDYIWVVATDPATINPYLVGAPFLYANDSAEYDFEFTRWSDPGSANSQVVVQPYDHIAPRRFNFSSSNSTHRLRWNATTVVFESWLPASQGGGRIFNWSYTGSLSGVVGGGGVFAPGPERVHINWWISNKNGAMPASSQFVVSCFTFCKQGSTTCTTKPLGSKPLCNSVAW